MGIGPYSSFPSLWPPYVIGQAIMFLPCGFYLLSFFLLFFLALSQRPQIGCLPYFGTWCGLSANLECRSEMFCMRLSENTERKKIAILAPSRVWGTPASFNGFRVLAALLHGTVVVGVSQTLRLCGVEHRALHIFGRAAIMLGIGPHF